MSEGHALLSPSGAGKWMPCTGSIAMEDGKPEGDTSFADEGTDAHQLHAMCLIEHQHPAAYIGRVLDKGHTVDTDMVAAVNVSVQHALEYARGGSMMVEQRLPVGHITSEPDAEGTGDVVIIPDDCEEIIVFDLKYGRGVRVNAERNPQLMLYALGAIEKFAALGDFKRARMVISQPRLDALSEWDCTIEELNAFAEEVKARGADALRAFEFRNNWLGNDKVELYLTPGDHCKSHFCKARATCPALARYVNATVFDDFDEMRTVPVPADNSAVGRYLARIDLIRDWCNQISAHAEAEMLGGRDVPGWKLVQGKRGNRAWTSAEEVEALLKKMRLKQEEIYDFKLISPTTAEKRLGDQPKRWNSVKAFITQSEGKPTVAEVSDKRPALVVKPVADDFESVAAEEPIA